MQFFGIFKNLSRSRLCVCVCELKMRRVWHDWKAHCKCGDSCNVAWGGELGGE